MSDQFIGQTLAEKYRIESVIRNGGADNIYRATHLLMDKPVTVKILAPEMAAGIEGLGAHHLELAEAGSQFAFRRNLGGQNLAVHITPQPSS